MTFHTFECKYPLSGSKFATIHKELKNLGSSYFENKPKMADENKKTDKITKYVCTALSQYGIIIYIILSGRISLQQCVRYSTNGKSTFK